MMLGHRQIITRTSRPGLHGRIARRLITAIMIVYMIARRPTMSPTIRRRTMIGVEAMMLEGQTSAGQTLAVWTAAIDLCLGTLDCP